MADGKTRSRRWWLSRCGGIGFISTAGCLRLADEADEAATGDTGGGSPDGSEGRDETPDPEEFDIELDPVWTGSTSSSLTAADGDFFFSPRFEFLERVTPGGETVFESEIEGEYIFSFRPEHRNSLTADESGIYVGANAREDEMGARIYAFDPESGEQQWMNEEPADGLHTDIGATVRADDLLIYSSHSTGSGSDQEPIVRALDADTGDERWSVEFSESFINGLFAADGRLFVQQTFNAYLYQLSTQELLDEYRWSTGFNRAATADGTIYVPGDPMRAVTLSSGDEQWQTETEYEINTTAGVGGSGVFVGTEAGYVLGFDRETGDELWEARADGSIEHRPIVEGGVVWIASARGGLSAFHEETGDRVYNEDVAPDFEFEIIDGIFKDSERETAFEIIWK